MPARTTLSRGSPPSRSTRSSTSSVLRRSQLSSSAPRKARPVLEVPVEAAPGDAERRGERLDPDGVRPAGRERPQARVDPARSAACVSARACSIQYCMDTCSPPLPGRSPSRPPSGRSAPSRAPTTPTRSSSTSAPPATNSRSSGRARCSRAARRHARPARLGLDRDRAEARPRRGRRDRARLGDPPQHAGPRAARRRFADRDAGRAAVQARGRRAAVRDLRAARQPGRPGRLGGRRAGPRADGAAASSRTPRSAGASSRWRLSGDAARAAPRRA